MFIIFQSTDRDYLEVANNDHNYDSVAVLLAVVGCFILIVGVMGFIGVICGPRMFGRILLMVVSGGHTRGGTVSKIHTTSLQAAYYSQDIL